MTGVLINDTGLEVKASWNTDLDTKELSESSEMVGKEKHISWSSNLRISSTKEQGCLSSKELDNSFKTVEEGEENLSRLLLEFTNLSLGGQQEAQEDVDMTVSEEAGEPQQMEEEEEELTDMSGATKAKKKRKRKHHRVRGGTQ